MKIELLDTVALVCDVPDLGLVAGEVGAVAGRCNWWREPEAQPEIGRRSDQKSGKVTTEIRLTEPSLARQTVAKQSQRNEVNEEARDERAFYFRSGGLGFRATGGE